MNEGKNGLLLIQGAANEAHYKPNYENGSGAAHCIHSCSLQLEAVLADQAFEVGEGNALHVECALQQCEADIPEVETLLAHKQFTRK